jgi:lipopolysaccharide export system permease protein
MKTNNLPHKAESNELWRILLLPLTYLSVAMIVLPFVFSSGRNTSTGKRLFIGIAIGLCFYVVSRILGSLSLVYAIHSGIAIAIAPLILIIVTLTLLNRHI